MLLSVGRISVGGNQPVDTTAKVTGASRLSSSPIQIGSALAGVVVVGGQGLDLGDGEVDGAGGGDGR